jgi:pyruvate dehydrogenase E1 component beta subunit
VRRTRRCVVFHEAVVTGGFGAELAALVSESLFGRLLAPVLRVGAVSAPLPYAKGLERLALPGKERLVAAITQATSTAG